MDVNPQLTSPTEVRALLDQLGHRPNRGLGQNYLIDANILDGIVQLAALESTDYVGNWSRSWGANGADLRANREF